jgi:hypothetical protein
MVICTREKADVIATRDAASQRSGDQGRRKQITSLMGGSLLKMLIKAHYFPVQA